VTLLKTKKKVPVDPNFTPISNSNHMKSSKKDLVIQTFINYSCHKIAFVGCDVQLVAFS
jgi:hypothetical protein